MHVHTESVVVHAPFHNVVSYITDPVNLPKWNVNSILDVQPGCDGRHRVRTPQGEQDLEIYADERTGTIDMVFHQEGQPGTVVPTRAIRCGTETVYLCTVVLPDLPGEDIERAKAGLREELRLLSEQAALL